MAGNQVLRRKDMKTVGIIAEFNPFHNGHEYLIQQARQISGADFVVAVMSGNFVQRGEPAVFNKHVRTYSALSCGVDAVFELPVRYSTASAEVFAAAGVGLLASLGCIDEIYFGSETGSIDSLMAIAEILVNEPGQFKNELNNKLKSGLSFPAAREYAIRAYLADPAGSSHTDLNAALDNGLLSDPNNILGIEYCKAILRLKFQKAVPRPCTVRREGSSYNSSAPDPDRYPSALSLREMLKKGHTPEELAPYVPSGSLNTPDNELNPLFPDDFSSALYMRLLDIRDSESSTVPESLLNAILDKCDLPISFTGLIEAVKTKNYTYSAISRALISVLLGTAPVRSAAAGTELPYARLLGIRKASSALIKNINEVSGSEIINKLADAGSKSPLLEEDIRASKIYNQVFFQKYGIRLPDEYRRSIIIL